MIRRIFEASWTFFQRMFERTFQFLSDLFGWLFQKLFDFLKILLQPIFVVIALLFYLIYKIAELAVMLIQVFYMIGKLLVAFVKGIFVTLAGFTYTPTTPNDGKWTGVLRGVSDGLSYFQLDTLALVLHFGIWFATAFAAIRIIGSIRNGGD